MSKDDNFWEPIKAVGLLFVVVAGLIAQLFSLVFILITEGVFHLKSAAEKTAETRKRVSEQEKLEKLLLPRWSMEEAA